jgi:carbon-monoxide dehydrogenase medium subunit
MLLREVEYARPSSVQEAIELLRSHDNARALAGGQSLVNVMKVRVSSPDRVVDLARVEDLKGIRVGADGALDIGAMVTYTELVESAELKASRPIIGEVAGTIADVQVRNRGTLGGNICLSDPTNHFPPLLVALGAEMTIAAAGGERSVSAEEFFVGVYWTAVEPGELLTRIRIPAAAGRREAFEAITIGKEGTCIVNVAVSLGSGDARIAVGCVSATPVRATQVEQALAEGDTGEAAVARAVEGFGATLDPPGDVHASAEYRQRMTEVLIKRAVGKATGKGN